MYDSDSNLERSSVALDKHDRNASKVKPKAHKHPLPVDYLAFLDLNYDATQLRQPQRGYVEIARTNRPGGAETYFNIGAEPTPDKPGVQNQDNAPLGTKILGGFIIPPFFSLSRNISKNQQEPSQNQNFFSNLLSRITSPARAQEDVAVVNIEHEFDVVTGTRPSMWEERRKAQAFLDSFLADCLRKDSSIYTPEEKIQMKKIQEILVREKEEERAMEKEREEKEREKRERTRRSKLRKGVGRKGTRKESEGKRKKTRNTDEQGCGDEEDDTTLGTYLSREHPLFARAFREKVRIYTPSGTEVSVDSNGAVSIVDDVRSPRRPRDGDDDGALRAVREDNGRARRKLRRQVSQNDAVPRRRSRHRGDVEVELSRKVMEENRKILQRLQIDQAREIELNKMIIEENRRTLRRLKMEKAEEKLRRSACKDGGRKVKKTCSGRLRRERGTPSSSMMSTNYQSNTPTNVVVSASVVAQESDGKATSRSECPEEESSKTPSKTKACSTDMLLKKRKAERRRKVESRDCAVDSVESKIEEETDARHGDKIVNDVRTRRKETKPEAKNLKTKIQETTRPNTQHVVSEFDDECKSDDVQVMFHNKRFLEGKSRKKNSPKHNTPVATDSSDVGRKTEHPDRMHNDVQPRCARNISRQYIERDTENDVKCWIQKNLATGNTFTASADYFDTSSRETVIVIPSEEVVTKIPVSKEIKTKHGYRYADQGDSREKTNPRSVKQNTTTQNYERELCEAPRREDYPYGDVRFEDDVMKAHERAQTPSSTGEECCAKSPYDFKPRRRCVNKRRKDRYRCRSGLTSSQESMAEVSQQRSNAIQARRMYRSNRRQEAKYCEAGRRGKVSMVTTPVYQRQREEYRQTFEEVQSNIREWDQVLKDRDQLARDMETLETNKSGNSVMEMLKAISKEEISSRGLQTSTDHGLGFGSEKEMFSPRVGSRVPKGRKVGLVVARPKPSFHRRSRHRDVRLKTKERKARNSVTIPGRRFTDRAAAQAELCPPVQDVSSEVVAKPTSRELREDTEKNADETKEDARAKILEMLKKVHVKAEKLGRIRKLMEAMEERGDIGDVPKNELLANMLLAVNLEGNDESENVKQVEKAVERKRDDHEVKHKRSSSKSPGECVQQVVAAEPVLPSQHRTTGKHGKHVVFPEHLEPDTPTSPTDHRTNERQDEDRKIHRHEKNLLVLKEFGENVLLTAQTHKQNSEHEDKPCVDEDVAQVTRRKKQHGGHRGKRTPHGVRGEQRVDDNDASNARSKHRTEVGGDVCRLDRRDEATNSERDVEKQTRVARVDQLDAGKSEAKQTDEVVTDRALACQEYDAVTDRSDCSKTRRDDVSEIITSSSVITSCFNNVRSKQMEEHMAKVLAEYLAKKQEFQQFIEQEELIKQRQMKCDDGQENDDCTARLECFGDVGCKTQANSEGGGQARDVIRISREVDIVRHVTTCCCAHSVCCKHDVEGVVEGLQSKVYSDDTKCGCSIVDFKESAQATNARCEESKQVLQQDDTTSRTIIGCRGLPSVLAEKENIMSLSHKYVKPLEFESDKTKKCCNHKCDEVKPETFTNQDTCREDYVIKTCNEGDVSKQVRTAPKDNYVEDEPGVISLMDPRRHFQRSTNAVSEIHETPEIDTFNDHFKPEKLTVVRQAAGDKLQQASTLDEDGRVPKQRLAGGCEGDHSRVTIDLTKRPDCMTRQQFGIDVSPTSGRRTGLAFDDANPASPERETRPRVLGSSVTNNVKDGFSREAEHIVDIHSEDVIQCRRDMTATHGDSTNIVSCIDTPDKAMEEIFKKMDDVIINRFLTLASINGITIVVTPRLVVNENAQAGNNEFKDDSSEEKLEEIPKEEFECGCVEKKENERFDEEEEGSGTNKEVVYKIVSANNKSEMFPPQVYKNEPEVTIEHRPECSVPGDRGPGGGASDKTLIDRIETVIGNQERMQQLALRNTHQLETAASCHFKKSDVYFISHMLCKSTGAIRREKKVQMRLRRSKTTKTRSKPWRVGRVRETRHGEPAAVDRQVSAAQQVAAAEASANLRLLEEIALINVPDTTSHASKEQQSNFDRCYEQVLRCLPIEKREGVKSPDKNPGKMSSKVSSGVRTKKGDDEIPLDRFLESVRNNLDEDELEMLEQASRTTVSTPVERRRNNNSKDVNVIYCSKTYDESNSTSTGAPNIKTIEEIIAEADNSDNLLSICECFGVDNINDLMGRLTSSDDVVLGKMESPRHGRRERRRGGHLKARHAHKERKTHRRKESRREENEVDKKEEARNVHSTSNSDENSKGREETSTTTDNSAPSPVGSFESKEVWRHRRLSKVIDIDEWIRDGAVATRGFTQQEENFVVPLKRKRNKKHTTDDPIEDACTPLSKFVLNYALKSGIILGGGTLTPDNDADDADCLNVKIELGDNKETLIVIQVPEEDTASRRSLKPSAGVAATPPHSSAQIVHVDSEEIVLSTDTPEALAAWTRAEQEAFREALKRHPPTPRVWDRIARNVGRSKRDCVLHFMRIWRRLEGAGGHAEQQ